MRRYQLFIAGVQSGGWAFPCDAEAQRQLRIVAAGRVQSGRLSCAIREGDRLVGRFEVGMAADPDD